jgi:hypothetical protein
MKFDQWLLLQVDRDDAVGDIARDVQEDMECSDITSGKGVDFFKERVQQHQPASDAALRALGAAFEEFRHYMVREHAGPIMNFTVEEVDLTGQSADQANEFITTWVGATQTYKALEDKPPADTLQGVFPVGNDHMLRALLHEQGRELGARWRTTHRLEHLFRTDKPLWLRRFEHVFVIGTSANDPATRADNIDLFKKLAPIFGRPARILVVDKDRTGTFGMFFREHLVVMTVDCLTEAALA